MVRAISRMFAPIPRKRHFEEWGALGARWMRIGCALDRVDGALYVRCGALLVVRRRCVGVRWGALGHVGGAFGA